MNKSDERLTFEDFFWQSVVLTDIHTFFKRQHVLIRNKI
jgi:hypothetical protein